MRVYCNICGINQAEYICLSCKKVFCDNCVRKEVQEIRMCKSCGSTNIQELNVESGKKFLCLDCGSSNISIGKKVVRYCPLCGSHVKNVNSLWNDAIATYRMLTNEITNAIQPISKLVTDLKLLKKRLSKLRNERILSDLDVDKQLVELLLFLNKSLFEIEKHLDILDGINFEIINDKEYYLANPTEFEKLMNNIESFNRVVKNLKRYTEIIIEELSAGLHSISEKIEKINSVKSFLNQYGSELKIPSEDLLLGVFEYKSLKSDFIDFLSNKGKLIVTDNQLIFFDKTAKRAFLQVSQIIDVKYTGIIRKRTRIDSKVGFIEFTLSQADSIRLNNLLNKLKNELFSKDTLLLQSITAVSFSPDISKVNTKLMKIIKKIRKNMYSRVESNLVHSSPEINFPPIVSGPPNNISLKENPSHNFVSHSQIRLIELRSKLHEIFNELEALKNSLSEGRITYSYYIKQYTEKYIEYYRIKNEIDKILNNVKSSYK